MGILLKAYELIEELHQLSYQNDKDCEEIIQQLKVYAHIDINIRFQYSATISAQA